MHFFQDNYVSDSVPFSLHPIERYLVRISLSTSNVNFDHLVEVMSARFLPCKVTLFPLVTYRYLVRRYFDSRQLI